jgi:hypothetical protein
MFSVIAFACVWLHSAVFRCFSLVRGHFGDNCAPKQGSYTEGIRMNLIITIASLLLSVWFGLRSMFQSQDREALQTALRAYNQALYNNLWRIGDNSDRALKANNLAEAQQLARGIADISHTARNMLIAFSKEHTRFNPSYERAWEPNPLGPEPKPSRLRGMFWI